MQVMGIDVGGSGIKGAPVDVVEGKLLEERVRIETPTASTPDKVAKIIGEICTRFSWSGPVSMGFPGIVTGGTIYSAANVDDSWVGVNASELVSIVTGNPVAVINDADAAGTAEMRYGAGRGRNGVIFVITVGTGLGTSMFTDGYLVPNVELGHLQIRGKDAEYRASDATRKRKKLAWPHWAKRFTEYLNTLEALFSPSLFIIGGGASRKTHKFFPHLNIKTEIVPAELRNDAGMIGAALAATEGPFALPELRSNVE
jgi:polyphosphate glucokinase